jgi:hypothetical protein
MGFRSSHVYPCFKVRMSRVSELKPLPSHPDASSSRSTATLLSAINFVACSDLSKDKFYL